MESELLKEWTEEERKEAAEAAAKNAEIKALRNTLLTQLEENSIQYLSRYGEKVLQVEDIDILNSLLKKVVKVDSLDEFEEIVVKALK